MLIQVHATPDLHVSPQQEIDPRSLSVGLAKTAEEIEAAQRLRHTVFSEEYGANLNELVPGIDEDKFDHWCDHLLVKDSTTNQVVGTYRILRPEQAVKAGGYYAESEFDLSGLDNIRDQIVEFGRACIDAEYRSGPTLMMLWTGLSELIRSNGYKYVLGCASVSLRDDGVTAAEVWRHIGGDQYKDTKLVVTPHYPYPVDVVNSQLPANVPALVAGYLKLGVKVCGAPAWDPDFNTADFPMLLAVDQMNSRYRRRLGFEQQDATLATQKEPHPS